LTVVLWLQSAPADTTINARSYGARGDGIHDDTQAIHLAIAALRPHSTLFFSCGTYLISSTLTISISDVTVTGVPGCAIIKSSGANGFAAMKVGGSGTGVKVPLLVDSGEQQKGFTADLQSAGIRVGDYAVLSDDLKGSAGGNAEVVRVVSVSGRNATTAEPLHTAFLRRNGSVVAKLEEAVTATVSHLVFDGSGNPNPDREGLSLVFAVNSGLTDVTAKDFAQAAIVLKYGHNNILRDLHIARRQPRGRGSGSVYSNGDDRRKSDRDEHSEERIRGGRSPSARLQAVGDRSRSKRSARPRIQALPIQLEYDL